MRRWVSVMGVMALGALALPPGASAAPGYAIVRKDASGSQRILVAAGGYSVLQRGRTGKAVDGMAVEYRKRTVAVLDVADRKVQKLALDAAVARAARERAALAKADPPYFRIPDRRAFPRERLRRLSATKRIKGLRAR